MAYALGLGQKLGPADIAAPASEPTVVLLEELAIFTTPPVLLAIFAFCACALPAKVTRQR